MLSKMEIDLSPEGIERARLRAGLTQKMLAEAMGISRRRLQRWLNGDAVLPPLAVERIVDVLDGAGGFTDALLRRLRAAKCQMYG